LTTHAVQVAEGLAARGIEVAVLTVRHSPELKRVEVLNALRVIRLQYVARFNLGMITPALLRATPLLINKHDVVQIHTPLPEGPIITSWCRLLHRPLLITQHSDLVMPLGFFNQVMQKVGYYVLLATGKVVISVFGHAQTEHLLKECGG